MSDDSVTDAAAARRRRAANNALGLGLVSLFFLAETIVAHHAMPSDHSPVIWFVLAAAALAGFIRYVLLVRPRGTGPSADSREG